MQRRITSTLGALVLVLGLAGGAIAAPASVGYVDVQKVFQNYKEAQDAQSRFRKEAQAYQEELAADQRKLEEARKAGKSQDELAKMQKQFEDQLKPKKSRVEQLDRDLSGRIKRQIEEVIGQVAKSKGIPTVVDKQVILYGGQDLTDEVLKKLNR